MSELHPSTEKVTAFAQLIYKQALFAGLDELEILVAARLVIAVARQNIGSMPPNVVMRLTKLEGFIETQAKQVVNEL